MYLVLVVVQVLSTVSATQRVETFKFLGYKLLDLSQPTYLLSYLSVYIYLGFIAEKYFNKINSREENIGHNNKKI